VSLDEKAFDTPWFRVFSAIGLLPASTGITTRGGSYRAVAAQKTIRALDLSGCRLHATSLQKLADVLTAAEAARKSERASPAPRASDEGPLLHRVDEKEYFEVTPADAAATAGEVDAAAAAQRAAGGAAAGGTAGGSAAGGVASGSESSALERAVAKSGDKQPAVETAGVFSAKASQALSQDVASLRVDDNYFGDDGAAVLAKLVAANFMEELSMQNVGLTDAGFSALLGALASGRSMRRLDLRNNPLIEMDATARQTAIGGLRVFNRSCQVLH